VPGGRPAGDSIVPGVERAVRRGGLASGGRGRGKSPADPPGGMEIRGGEGDGGFAAFAGGLDENKEAPDRAGATDGGRRGRGRLPDPGGRWVCMENWCIGRRGRFADVHNVGSMETKDSRVVLVLVARSRGETQGEMHGTYQA
jgi:hypothetical protein